MLLHTDTAPVKFMNLGGKCQQRGTDKQVAITHSHIVKHIHLYLHWKEMSA